MKASILRVIFVLAVLLNANGLCADPLSQWTWRFPSPQGYTLRAVTYGGGQFVAVGDNGTIITSLDGYHWTNLTFGVFSNLRGVAYATGCYAVVGDEGIMISTNAINWNQIPSVTSNALHGIAGNSGWRTNNLPQFVAVGNAGAVIVCSNNTNWRTAYSGTTNSLYAVQKISSTYYLMVGDIGTVIRLSATGFSQPPQTLVGTTNNLYTVASDGNGVTVAGGDLTRNPFAYTAILTNEIIFSLNSRFYWSGEQWLNGSSDQGGPDLWYLSDYFILTGMTYGSNGFVGVGYTGYGLEYHPAVVMTSANGTSWTEMPASTSENSLCGVTYGNGLYVAVGDFGSIVVSTNAVNWTEIIPNRRSDILAVACNSNVCIASAMHASYSWGFPDFSTLVSKNGINWSASAYNLAPMADLKCNEIEFVGVGANKVFTTTDGDNWLINSSFTNNLYGVTYANGQFVIVGENGSIFSSTNGTNWNNCSVTTAGALRGVAFGNGLYVAAGSVGAISTDGVSWNLCPSNQPGIITRIVYGRGSFVAIASVGWSGEILTSQDGIYWQVQFVTVGNALTGIAYDGGTFLAISSYGAMFKSIDGTNWIQMAQGLPAGLFNYYNTQYSAPYILDHYYSTVCAYQGTFFAAGTEGNLLQSGTTWNATALTASAKNSHSFIISYTQQIDVPYRIQSSTNLFSWQDIYRDYGSGMPTNFIYTTAANDSAHFFRIISP